VVDRIREENLDLPAGEVAEGERDLLVRTYGQFQSPDEIEDVILTTRDGVPIHVRDVATVVDGLEEERQVQRIDGRPGISLRIIKQATFNTVDVADTVHAELDRIEREMPSLTFAILSDQSDFIKDAIAGVQSAALFGAVLAIVILLVFLRNFRSTLIIASAIPIAVMAAFSLMYFGGFTLNIVSFGGLALGIGLLVDNAIVVLENIYRHLENGEERKAAAEKGTQEVAMAIIASTMTTVVVFVPLLFLTGPARIMFGQLAYIVAFSLVCSLFVALTLIPMLASRILRYEPLEAAANESLVHKAFRVSERAFERLDLAYKGLLHFCLRHSAATLFAGLAIFCIAVPFFRVIPFEFMPATDEGEIDIDAELAPGTNMETMDATFTLIEEAAFKIAADYVEHFETSFGATSWWRGGGGNTGEVELALKDVEERDMTSEDIAALLRKELPKLPGVDVRVRPSGGLFIFRILEGEDDINVDIRGHDQEKAAYIAKQVRDVLETVPGITGAYLTQDDARPDVGVLIDRKKAAEFGLSVQEIARTLRIIYGGQRATLYREGGDEYEVMVRLAEQDRVDADTLEDLWVVTPAGERVAVSNFIRQTRGTGPTSITRVDKERSLTVAANLEPGVPLGNIMGEVQDRLGQLPIPEDFSLVYGGEYEDQQESFAQLQLGIILAILLIYMVMASQFESLLHPLVIMFAIPFAAIGVVIVLLATDTTLNIQSILGITMLTGIAVNNAIVLIDYINMLRRDHGLSLVDAVEQGGRFRLRPILMTTFTTMLALAPMSLGLGAGGELQAPMARVVIGGLLTSMLITLVFVPVLYTTAESLVERRRAKRAQRQYPASDEGAIAAK